MNTEKFRTYLKRGGRSKSAIKRILSHTREFQVFLEEHSGNKPLAEADPEDLEQFVGWIEREPKSSAKLHLWALRYHFGFSENEEMRQLASLLREQRVKRSPFPLRDFRGVNQEEIERLAAVGINNISQMLKKGRTTQQRKDLSEKTGVSLESIVELVKLSDLARIPGVKGIRARLYFDAGVDSIEKLAQWKPVAFREMIVEFVERTNFDGTPTLPAEARYSIKKAKELPRVVEYE